MYKLLGCLEFHIAVWFIIIHGRGFGKCSTKFFANLHSVTALIYSSISAIFKFQTRCFSLYSSTQVRISSPLIINSGKSFIYRFSLFPNSDIPFAHNSSIIELIEGKYYLYEILAYFSEQFEMIIRTIGNNSSDSIFDDIIFYINHNFSKPLKLETHAPLFGYNSSYLGKLFSQKTGTSFNSYLDSVRITEAAKLLKDTNLKVYEISAQVGYKNVDYFHQKFKKIKNVSPAEFRKNL